jgi:protease I
MGDERQVNQAGEGLSDEEMVRQVAAQTDSEHQQADVFEREGDGATTDTEAAKATGDELSDG